HLTGVVLIYVLGTRADAVFTQRQALLKPFGLVHCYTDGAGVYTRHLSTIHPTVRKRQTQQIERKHLTWRTRIKRLARKTIGFSKLVLMHDTVIGLFVNRYEFGNLISHPHQQFENTTPFEGHHAASPLSHDHWSSIAEPSFN